MGATRRTACSVPRAELTLDVLPTTPQTSKHTQDVGQIQKAADFLKAFALGFEVAVSSASALFRC